jgi:hypothetical protein
LKPVFSKIDGGGEVKVDASAHRIVSHLVEVKQDAHATVLRQAKRRCSECGAFRANRDAVGDAISRLQIPKRCVALTVGCRLDLRVTLAFRNRGYEYPKAYGTPSDRFLVHVPKKYADATTGYRRVLVDAILGRMCRP